MAFSFVAGVAVIVSAILFERRKAELAARWKQVWEEFQGWEA